jgi:hypothetical protein
VRYVSGQDVLPGDAVQIDTRHRGKVVACIAEDKYLPPHSAEQWGYLNAGVLIDTDFGGLVHYPGESDLADDRVELLERASPQ